MGAIDELLNRAEGMADYLRRLDRGSYRERRLRESVAAVRAELAARGEALYGEAAVNIKHGMAEVSVRVADPRDVDQECCLTLQRGRSEITIRRLPDEPERVEVWERPEICELKTPLECSNCGRGLWGYHLGGRCPNAKCGKPLASTPSPWPGGRDG